MRPITNADIEELDLAASGTAAEFKDYLDQKSGYAEAIELGYSDDFKNTQIVLSPNPVFKGALSTQTVATLVEVIRAGDIIDRLVASIRLLALPPIFATEDVTGDAMRLAQKTLSETLVAHPALLHPRVFMRATHFATSEYGPVSFVMAGHQRIDFPRVAHGITPERMRIFAKHHCVRSAFSGVSPKPSEREHSMQGKTMLQSLGQLLTIPRRALLISALELDEHRAHGQKRKPAPLLATQDKAVNARLRQMVANTLLSAFGLWEGKAPLEFDATELVRLLKSSGMSDAHWFMEELESSVCRSHATPDEKLGPGLKRLSEALLQLQPRNWHGPEPITPGVPITERMVSRWLTVALLDTSIERCEVIEKRNKSLGILSRERKEVVLAAIDSVHPAYWEQVSHLVERIFADRIDSEGQGWRVARVAYAMQRSMAQAEAPRAGAAPATDEQPQSVDGQASSLPVQAPPQRRLRSV